MSPRRNDFDPNPLLYFALLVLIAVYVALATTGEKAAAQYHKLRGGANRQESRNYWLSMLIGAAILFIFGVGLFIDWLTH